MMKYVLGFAFIDSGQNVLHQYKLRPEWQAGKINMPGGKVEDEEKPLEAMVREWKEETGSVNYDWDLFCILKDNKNKIWIYCYRVFSTRVVHATRQLPGEHMEKIGNNRVDVLIESGKLIPNLKWLLAMAQSREVEFAQVNATLRGEK